MINSKDLQISPIKRAKTIPAKWYHSKKIFDLENKMVFLNRGIWSVLKVYLKILEMLL